MLDIKLSETTIGFNRQTIILVATLLLLLGIVTVASYLTRRSFGLNAKYYKKRWLEVVQLSKLTAGYQLAIIEADKLVDQALKRRYFKGKTMGERLVSAGKTLKNQDSIWRAHKLRNRLVHESNSTLSKKELRDALNGYQQALRDLGALR